MTTIQIVQLNELVEDPDNPRVDVGDVSALATSIKNLGLQQALRVRQLDDGTFAVVAGSRRHAAMREAKLPGDYAVPVTITSDNGSSSTLTGLVENAQRENLSRWEQADAFARLRHEFGMKQKQIADLTGFDPSLISRRIAQADLSQTAREAIDRVANDTRLDDEEITKLARAHNDVPDEVWSVINNWGDVQRMVRAQQMVALRERVSETLNDEPIVDDFDSIEVPKGYRLVEHQDRSANDPTEVDVHPGDAGVMRRYFSWIPFTIEEVPEAEVEAEKQERDTARAEAKAARERSDEARKHWWEQWIAVIEKMTPAACKELVLESWLRDAEREFSSHPLTGSTIDRLDQACGWAIDEGVTKRQHCNMLLRAKNGWRVAALAVILSDSSAFTGDPADTRLPEWLEELRKEHKVRIPRVKANA